MCICKQLISFCLHFDISATAVGYEGVSSAVMRVLNDRQRWLTLKVICFAFRNKVNKEIDHVFCRSLFTRKKYES